jgi:hypothetical protein
MLKDWQDQAYNAGISRDQSLYDRATSAYDRDAGKKQALYDRDKYQTEMGMRMAEIMANSATGQGSKLADYANMAGNINAQRAMAEGNWVDTATGVVEGIGKGAKAVKDVKDAYDAF